jgi:hypothetical protein
MKILFGLCVLTLLAGCASNENRTPQQVYEERNDPPPTEPLAPTVPNFSPFGP